MLKLAYTDNDLHIERLATSVEKWISQRVLLALRTGSAVSVEPMNAAFGLATNLGGWSDLEYLICREASEIVSLSVCDADVIELGLEGYWLSSSSLGDEGLFVTHLPAAIEARIVEIWQASRQKQPAFNHCCPE
jgi:hypothetical protein